MKDHTALRNEIRYAERLCQRTARLYRRVQTVGTWLTVVGGSGTLGALSSQVAPWVPVLGATLLTLAGAALVAIRPADKAAANEADVRRYAALLAQSPRMSADELEAALEVAHQTDCAEVEPLRYVAWNDVAREIGRADAALPLTTSQRLIALLA